MVRIRMKSMGRKHRPFFRICAMDARTPRDGRSIEQLGYYDPLSRNPETQEVLKADRIRYWLSVGAAERESRGDPQTSRHQETRPRRTVETPRAAEGRRRDRSGAGPATA